MGGVAITVAMLVVIFLVRQEQASVQNEIVVAEGEEIGDHVIGDTEAPVIIYEYMDYQCEHCANLNLELNNLLKEYDGKVALVVRTYVRTGSKNGFAAATAAEAAGLQGYFQEYKDLLLLRQNDWADSDPAARQQQFERYFEQISDGRGDLEQFQADINSEKVARKLEFDESLAKAAKLTHVPLLFVNNIRIELNEMGVNLTTTLREKIDFSLNLWYDKVVVWVEVDRLMFQALFQGNAN